MRQDSYAGERTTRNTDKDNRSSFHYHNMLADDPTHAKTYPHLRQQAEDAIEVISFARLRGRLKRFKMFKTDDSVTALPGIGKYLLSEGCEDLPILIYFQDPHADWLETANNIEAYKINNIVPASMLTSLEPHGSVLRFWKRSEKKAPNPTDFKDVHIPYRATILWRGDSVHCGLGYMKENRRHFRYLGISGFPDGETPLENEVEHEKTFIRRCRKMITSSPPVAL